MEIFRATSQGWVFLVVMSPSAMTRDGWEADEDAFLDGTAVKNGMILHLTPEIRRSIREAIWAQTENVSKEKK